MTFREELRSGFRLVERFGLVAKRVDPYIQLLVKTPPICHTQPKAEALTLHIGRKVVCE